MDETGLTTVSNKIPQVKPAKGKRSVNRISSAERRQLVTAGCSVRGSRHDVTPAIMYSREGTKVGLFNPASPDTILTMIDKRYINTTLFVDFLEQFQLLVNTTKENPALLILGNPSSHCSNEGVLLYI